MGKKSKGGKNSKNQDNKNSAGGDDENMRRITMAICGDGSVGKTTICKRMKEQAKADEQGQKLPLIGGHLDEQGNFIFTGGMEEEEYTTTVFDTLEVELLINSKKVLFTVVDTAGQEEYQKLNQSSIIGVDLILLVFDLCSLESFENIEKFIDLGRRENKRMSFLLVGNKLDKADQFTARGAEDTAEGDSGEKKDGEEAGSAHAAADTSQREVTKDRIDAYMKQTGNLKNYIEISALCNLNMSDLYEIAASFSSSSCKKFSAKKCAIL
ncbi:MAG: Rho GTPase [Marteilia pararefringens]